MSGVIIVTVEGEYSRRVSYSWDNSDKFIQNWREDKESMPNLEDPLIHASIDGLDVAGKTFQDVVNCLEAATGIKFTRSMFEVEAINYFGNDEDWAWDSIESLQTDYAVGDMLALPNDFDEVRHAYINGEEVEVKTFGEFIQYVKDNIESEGWPKEEEE